MSFFCPWSRFSRFRLFFVQNEFVGWIQLKSFNLILVSIFLGVLDLQGSEFPFSYWLSSSSLQQYCGWILVRPELDNICAYILLRCHVRGKLWLEPGPGLCLTIVNHVCINVSAETERHPAQSWSKCSKRLKDGRCERRDRLTGNTSIGSSARSGESEIVLIVPS